MDFFQLENDDQDKVKKFVKYGKHEMNNHEKELFCSGQNRELKLSNVVEYKIKNNIYKVPYPVYKTLFSIWNNIKNVELPSKYPKFSIWSNIKDSNSKYYREKWIYQIINGVYEIHEIRKTFIGAFSDECIAIDDQLNAKIEFFRDFPLNPSSETEIVNSYYYCEPKRIKDRDIKNFDEIDKNDIEANLDTYKKYDIFALGKIVEEIRDFQKTSFDNKMSKNEVFKKLEDENRYSSNNANNTDGDSNDDESDEYLQITNNIINLCLLPFDERPTINKIHELINSQLKKFTDSNENYNSQNVLKFLKENSDLIKYFFIDPKVPNFDYFKLNNSCLFEVFYKDDCFHAVPECVDDKYCNDFYNKFFFSNLYFCNLKDLLKVYACQRRVILYWFLYLSDYISNMHEQGDYLPDNFTMENVFVSFMYNENEFQTQLSIFPYEIKEAENSSAYVCPDINAEPMCKDVYSFGVLMLEILYKFSTRNFLFQEGPKELQIEELNRIKDDIYEDLHPLFELINNCIISYESFSFEKIQEKIDDIIKGNEKLNIRPLFDKCKRNPTMNKDRFISLFNPICYSSMAEKNLLILFNNRLNCFLKDFNSESLFFDPGLILKYLKKKKEEEEAKEEAKEEEAKEEEAKEEEEINKNDRKEYTLDFEPPKLPRNIMKTYFDSNTIYHYPLVDCSKNSAYNILSSLLRINGRIIDLEIINSSSDDDLLTIDYLEEIAKKLKIKNEKIDKEKIDKEILRLYIQEPQIDDDNYDDDDYDDE